MRATLRIALAGAAAGAINGIFGAGGGMILVPLLTAVTDMADDDIFPSSVSIILPICLVSLALGSGGFPFWKALPYLLGGLIGGIIAGKTEQNIPVKWLHRILGLLILWGGYRYLC